MLERFFEAERRYMQEGGSFEELRATMADDVVLHQSPDLPWGGEYVGPKRYEEWARAMSAVFDQVDMREPRFFEQGDTVVIVGTLVTRLRATGETMELPMAQMVRVEAGRSPSFGPSTGTYPRTSKQLEKVSPDKNANGRLEPHARRAPRHHGHPAFLRGRDGLSHTRWRQLRGVGRYA